MFLGKIINFKRFFSLNCISFFSSPEILTMNMTHTGEQGYVLYIPNEFAVEIYDSIMEAGKKSQFFV